MCTYVRRHAATASVKLVVFGPTVQSNPSGRYRTKHVIIVCNVRQTENKWTKQIGKQQNQTAEEAAATYRENDSFEDAHKLDRGGVFDLGE